MTARELKDALRARHPATNLGTVGAWTCIEEFHNIDLLAVAAWSSLHYKRIGYEVKVSRADYRRELGKPDKRMAAVRWCHEFYFAVPADLLKPEEIAWTPPEGFDSGWRSPFDRERCPGAYGAWCHEGRIQLGIQRGVTRWEGNDYTRAYDAPCPTCRGQGWIVEAPTVRFAAPRLWVPADVGLMLVDGRGCTIVKRPPRRKSSDKIDRIADKLLGEIVRHTSVRPDPRHDAIRPR